jgi:hypothetical protein
MSHKFKAIKAAQLAEAEKTGVNPYGPSTPVRNDPPSLRKGHALAHFQAAMQADLASLKALKTLDEKKAAKAKMLEAYRPFVDDYLKQGHDYPNDVAVQAMIWLLDVGDIEAGLNLALTLIRQGHQKMPERFDRRDIETFLCDAMYDWANALLKKEQSVSPYFDILAATLEKDGWDVHPAVAGKVYAMLAKHKMREGDYPAVIDLCDKAMAANPDGAGVKSLRSAATSKLRMS